MNGIIVWSIQCKITPWKKLSILHLKAQMIVIHLDVYPIKWDVSLEKWNKELWDHVYSKPDKIMSNLYFHPNILSTVVNFFFLVVENSSLVWRNNVFLHFVLSRFGCSLSLRIMCLKITEHASFSTMPTLESQWKLRQ